MGSDTPATGPETGTHEPPQDGSEGEPGPHHQTTTGAPRPAAKASDAHDPEPEPQKQAEEEAEGRTADGHGRETKPTTGPPAATPARTQATDRRASAAPNETPGEQNEATENTRAEGTAERANESAPGAQPTQSGERAARARATEPTSPEKRTGREREPETAAITNRPRELKKTFPGDSGPLLPVPFYAREEESCTSEARKRTALAEKGNWHSFYAAPGKLFSYRPVPGAMTYEEGALAHGKENRLYFGLPFPV